VASGDIGLVRELIELQAPLRSLPVTERRRQYDRAEQTFGRSNQPGEVIDANGCPAEWVRAQREPPQPVILYIHGGGYSLGSTRSHRHLAAAIGQTADAAVLSIDYRRAPEHPYPTAVEDATAATRWLLTQTHSPVVLAGDSAGGGLVVAALIALRAASERMPTAGICLSPWLDLTCTADALTRIAAHDPLLSRAELKRMADAYLQEADPRQPLASPVFADLTGLPPLLIQVGSDEILLDDARRLAEQARTHGVPVTLEEWPDMIHAWQWYFPVLREGREAIDAIATFMKRRASSYASQQSRTASRTAPASPTQEAHLLIAPETAGRGFLSWIYQLNGPLNHDALAHAIDEVVRRHDILRVRFEQHSARLHQVVTPFKPGALQQIDLRHQTKRHGLQTAFEDATRVYHALSPNHDPRFRATLYRLDRKTSVLAMFVAEALIDSDSGSLLAGEISRAYARHNGTAAPASLPAVSDVSYLDYVTSHPPDQIAITASREHWLQQSRQTTTSLRWPKTDIQEKMGSTTAAFALYPPQWLAVESSAQQIGVTPYVFVLACLQLALAHAAQLAQLLVHTVIPQQTSATNGIIGNFHSIARIATRIEAGTTFTHATTSIAVSTAEAIEHSVLPAPLALRSCAESRRNRYLPDVRFYMFTSHQGPMFAGIRRRRLRLHNRSTSPLAISCIYTPSGKQDFVFSSTTAAEPELHELAAYMRRVLDMAVESPDLPPRVGGSCLT
jgi:acetyl esterase/lipase